MFGIIAAIYVIIDAIRKYSKESLCITIFMLSTYLPYIFIGRIMFMYHFFATLPFIMLAIVAFIKWISEKTKNNRIYYGYIALIIITFIVFMLIV